MNDSPKHLVDSMSVMHVHEIGTCEMKTLLLLLKRKRELALQIVLLGCEPTVRKAAA